MADLDERVLSGLRELVERAPADADVWDATGQYVTKHRRRRQATWAAAAVVAIAIGIASATTLVGAEKKSHVTVTPPEPIPTGAVLLEVRAHQHVVAVDANGRDLGTVYSTDRSAVAFPQLARDHKTLWYVTCNQSEGSGPCDQDGDVVEVDLETGRERVLTRAQAFSMSPNGARVAISRQCTDGLTVPCTTMWIHELPSGSETQLPGPLSQEPQQDFGPTLQIVWSPDGAQVIFTLGHMVGDLAEVYDVALEGGPGRPEDLSPGNKQFVFAWTDRGLLAAVTSPPFQEQQSAVVRFDALPVGDAGAAALKGAARLLDTGEFYVEDLVSTKAGVFVVAERYTRNGEGGNADGMPRLYRLDAEGAMIDVGAVARDRLPFGAAFAAVP